MPTRFFSTQQIIGDIYGGVTAAIIALPLALAFGIASGLGAAAGLYGAIALGFFASLFGGTPSQISGPTGPMTVIMATIVFSLGGNVSLIMGTVFLAGLLQILFGILRIGGIVRYVPYPVISGFMSGIGIIIIILQLNPFLGAQSHGKALQTLLELHLSFQEMQYSSMLLGLFTLLIVLFAPSKITRYLPAPLIALIAGTLLSQILGLDVATVKDIPRTLPSIIMPTFTFETSTLVITSALTLAILGTIDSLLTSLVADSITKTKHRSNRELIGQGLGNIATSLIGGIPGAGATMRTVINVKSGGTTRLSGMIHAIVLLLTLLTLAPLAEYLPLAVLAALLIKVGLDILDYKMLHYIKVAPKYDLIVMITVFFLTVFVDLIVAVGAGIVLASMLITYRISIEANVEIGSIEPELDSLDDRVLINTIRIININGAFFFGSASQILDRADTIYGIKHLIIDCTRVPFIDVSAIFALEEMIAKLSSREINVFLVLKDEHREKLMKLGILEFLSPEQMPSSQLDAIKLARQQLKEAKG